MLINILNSWHIMGVNLFMEDESGTRLANVLDPRGYVICIVSLAAQRDTVCLRFVDPYGDTVFNQLQIPVLIHELEAARDLVTDQRVQELAQQRFGPTWEREATNRQLSAPEIRMHLDQLLNLARRCHGEVHTYLKFYGD